jgi:hypothetical protein
MADELKLPKNERCCSCGTDLEWWLKELKRNRVYRTPADEYFCTMRCLKEYSREYDYEVIKP